MIEKTGQIAIEKDSLFKMFEAALTSGEDPLNHFAGRYFTGTTNAKHGERDMSSDPNLWAQYWKELGHDVPPMALPTGCRFEFLLMATPNHDSTLEPRRMLRTPGGLKMEWDWTLAPKQGERGKAAWYMLIVPEQQQLESSYRNIYPAAARP